MNCENVHVLQHALYPCVALYRLALNGKQKLINKTRGSRELSLNNKETRETIQLNSFRYGGAG